MAKRNAIRVGLIGLGRAGWETHTKEIAERPGKFEIVAACDPIAERRKLCENQFGCKTHRKDIDLINDPDVELVDIACPSLLHLPLAKAALKAGKMVFMEKPIGVNLAETRQIAKLAEKHPNRLFLRHNRRFEPMLLKIKSIIKEDKLGEIVQIKLRRNRFQRRNDWQVLKQCGGGQLLNWGVHIIDHALILLDSPVVDIFSHLARTVTTGNAEDHIKILLLGKNGCLADVEISDGVAMGAEPEWKIIGKKGTLVADDNTLKYRVMDMKKTPKRAKASPKTPPHYGQTPKDPVVWKNKTLHLKQNAFHAAAAIWDALYDAIRRDKPFPVPPKEILEVMRIINVAKKQNPKFL